MTYFRYWLGRHIMHLGLNLMPRGRSKDELNLLLLQWGRHAKETLDARRSEKAP